MALASYEFVKTYVRLFLHERVKRRMMKERGIFDIARTVQQHEGHEFWEVDATGKVNKSTYRRIKDSFKLSNEEIMNLQVEDLIRVADEVGTKIGGDQQKQFLQQMKKTAEESGNLAQKGEELLSVKTFLEALAKMDIAFDENEQPILPTIIVPESSGAVAAKVRDSCHWSKKEKNRFKVIIRKKLKEWHERNSHRKLVD